MINEEKQRRRIDRKRESRLRAAFVLVVLVCITLILIGSIYYSNSESRAMANQIEAYEARLEELTETHDRLQTTQDQMSKDKLFIWDFLRQCRVAEDIPVYPGRHVIVQHRGERGFVLCLPEGNHRLKVSSQRPPEPHPSADEQTAEAPVEPHGEKAWEIPLRGATGYMFRLESDYAGGPVRWEVTANTSDFQTRQETILPGDFNVNSWSFSGNDLALFPNQVQNKYGLSELEAAANNPSSLGLFDVKLSGQYLGKPLSILVTARLSSDGPATVTAGGAQGIISRRRPDLLMPYQGGGKYELRPAAGSASDED